MYVYTVPSTSYALAKLYIYKLGFPCGYYFSELLSVGTIHDRWIIIIVLHIRFIFFHGAEMIPLYLIYCIVQLQRILYTEELNTFL